MSISAAPNASRRSTTLSSAVPGVKATTAAKGVKTFQVTGDFKDVGMFRRPAKDRIDRKCGWEQVVFPHHPI